MSSVTSGWVRAGHSLLDQKVLIKLNISQPALMPSSEMPCVTKRNTGHGEGLCATCTTPGEGTCPSEPLLLSRNGLLAAF